MRGKVPGSHLWPIFDLQPETDQRRGVLEWWGRRGGGVYSVVGRGFLFCLVWWGGLAMEDALWTMPLLRYSGDSGVPGRRRYRPATPYARLLHGLDRGGRSGTAPTRGLAVLSFRGGCATLQNRVFHTPRQPKGAGSSCRPHRSSSSTLPKRPGAGSNGGNDLDTGGTEDFSARSGPSA